ncbi:PDR/VanB family oxidoreductase [Pseudomonas japonica]|uniref:PDR/VanB family oxidoreductase n=1 Tax=Pseudomonas japonica TaxID=256466 RepID=UPI003815246A
MPTDLKVRVAAKVEEAEDICSFMLVPVEPTRLPEFSAGAHIDVCLPGGPTRQYSLCNATDDSHGYRIAVLHDPLSRGGSRQLHERVESGDILSISAPRNLFGLHREARHSLLLAGGIGITPLLAMAQCLSATDASFALHYCTRSRRRTAFLERIAGSPFAARVRFHFDDEADSPRLDLAATLASPSPDTHLYVCGPKGFMDAVLGTARAMGWAEDRLHYEFFAAEARQTGSDDGFEVQLASTGEVVAVGHDESVVQALARAGIRIETSCEQGICGSCLTGVIDGEPEHHDVYLSAAERAANDQFLPCCSRAKSARLVLDL